VASLGQKRKLAEAFLCAPPFYNASRSQKGDRQGISSAGERQGRRKPSTIANPKGKDITPLEGKFLSSFYTRYSPMQSAPSSDPPRLHVAERCQLGGRVRATALISSARGTARPLGRTRGRRAGGGQSQSSRRSSVTIPSCAECDARRPAIKSI
jgi:hypothetical protein